jgi:hypothetical protein
MMGSIRNRRDLARHLQEQMIASRSSPLRDADELEHSGRTLVKTYLLEAHEACRDDVTPAQLLSDLSGVVGFKVRETDDPDLSELRFGDEAFWCDTSLRRYWRLHTIAAVDRADKINDQLVSASTHLDKVWLPPPYLESLAARTGAKLRLFCLSHDRRDMHRAVDSQDLDFVTLRLWSSRANEAIGRLRRADVFPRGMSIRSVKIHTGSADSGDDFIAAEYFHHGKVSVNGNSFDEHNRVLMQVLADYAKMVEKIEHTYAIGLDSNDRHIVGDPITIDIDWTLQDLEYVVGRIFGSVEPFRLWGVPQRIGPEHYRARAVDLHVGATLVFDVMKDKIVIQLPTHTCGNTVVRFLNALQYHVNSDVGRQLLC